MKESKNTTSPKDKSEPIWHPTQHDESDELEEAKKATEEYEKLLRKKQALLDEIEEAKEKCPSERLGWEETYKLFTRETAQYPKEVEMEYLMILLLL